MIANSNNSNNIMIANRFQQLLHPPPAELFRFILNKVLSSTSRHNEPHSSSPGYDYI